MRSMSVTKLAATLLLLSACKSPDFTLSPGIEVDLNGYEGATQQEMQAAVDECISDVKSTFPSVNINAKFAVKAYLSFQPELSDCRSVGADCPTKMVGWTDGTRIVVSYSVRDSGQYVADSRAPLQRLSFKHEITHVILMRAAVVPSSEQDAFIAKNYGY